jgi:hypothetical protein
MFPALGRVPVLGGGAPGDIESRLRRAGGIPFLPTTDTGFKAFSADGASRLFLPALTNYVTNPRLVDGNADGLADGFTLSGAAGAPVYSVTANGDGTFTQRIRYTGVAGDNNATVTLLGAASAAASFAQNDPVTVSKVISALALTGCAASVIVQCLSDADAVLSTDTVAVAATGRFSVTKSAAPATTSKTAGGIRFTGVDAGDVIDISFTAPTRTKTAYPVPYFDGFMTANRCSWSGSADASTSVVAASDLRFPVGSLFGAAMTVAARVDALHTAAYQTNDYWLIDTNSKVIFGAGWNSAWKATLVYGATATISTTQVWTPGTPKHVVWRYDGTTMDMNLSGTTIAQVPHALGPPVGVGTHFKLSSVLSRQLGTLVLSPTRKPDSWVTAIQANNGAAYDDVARLFFEFMASGDAMVVHANGDSKLWVKP